MKIAKLEILGIEFPLSKNQEFSDDGFVNSLKDYKIWLLKRYTSYQPEEELNKGEFGTTGTFRVSANVYYHIAYTNQGDEGRNINTRAHEETHVLNDLGHLDLLTAKILDDLNINLDLSLINLFNEKELIADIGGIYALYKRKIDPYNIKKFRSKKFQEALEIYEEVTSKKGKFISLVKQNS